MSGDYVDRDYIVVRGDTRVAMTIQRNEHTVKFNRKSRFLIDDTDSDIKLSFALTKPLKVGHVRDNKGILKFVLSETNSTDFDNMHLSIPDYYKYFPENSDSDVEDIEIENEKEVWI